MIGVGVLEAELALRSGLGQAGWGLSRGYAPGSRATAVRRGVLVGTRKLMSCVSVMRGRETPKSSRVL